METDLHSSAAVVTAKPVAYMRQLCKHFGHKVDAEFGESSGWIEFSMGRCELEADAAAGVLQLTVSAASEVELERMREVIGSHLKRFGKRDELSVSWDR